MEGPQSFLLYGTAGGGRTTDARRFQPKAIRFSVSTQAFQVWESVLGLPAKGFGQSFTFDEVEVRRIKAIKDVIRWVKATLTMPDFAGYGYIFDELTMLAETTARNEYDNLAITAKSGHVNWFPTYEEVSNDIVDLLNLVWQSGRMIVCTMQTRAPKFKEGDAKQLIEAGGPLLFHKQSAANLVHGFSGVYKTGWAPNREPWGLTYSAPGPRDPEFPTKCRLNIVSRMEHCPANLSEIMRAAGYPVEYPADILPRDIMLDMRKLAYDLSNQGKAWQSIKLAAQKRLEETKKTINPKYLQWALSDGCDCATIEKGLK